MLIAALHLIMGSVCYVQASEKQADTKPGRVILNKPCIVSGDHIQISWKKAENAKRYQIYRKENGKWKKIATCRENVLSYTDKTTIVGVSYQYKVRANNKAGGKYVYGSFSKNSPVITQKYDSSPVKISYGKSKSPGTVKLKWNARANATGYIIYRKTDGTSWKKIKTVGKATSFTDKNLAGGTEYYYTVRAFKKANASAGIPKTIYGSYDKEGVKITVMKDKWGQLLDKYRADESTNQLVFVKYTGGSSARVEMYQKSGTSWDCILDCSGYVGQNGIDKQIEGDRKTPTGTFNLTSAFGIRKDPGAKMPYVRVNKYLYWCGDAQYYNRLIDVREKPHVCSGEHLIDYVPHYYYGMFLDYNKECTYKKGSAIFLHCTGSNPYTGGCIAVSQADMIKIIQNAEPGAKICIYSI